VDCGGAGECATPAGCTGRVRVASGVHGFGQGREATSMKGTGSRG
jgi:hypothetical protein